MTVTELVLRAFRLNQYNIEEKKMFPTCGLKVIIYGGHHGGPRCQWSTILHHIFLQKKLSGNVIIANVESS